MAQYGHCDAKEELTETCDHSVFQHQGLSKGFITLVRAMENTRTAILNDLKLYLKFQAILFMFRNFVKIFGEGNQMILDARILRSTIHCS